PGDNFFQFKYCIAKKGAKSTLLFLDFAGKGARNRWGQIDLSDEFLLLKDYVCRDTIIIIDDIHCFQTDMCCIKKGYYPHLREIEQFVKKQLNGFDFYIIGDQAIIYNPSYFGEAASQGVKLLTKLYLCSSYGEFKKLAALVPETFTEKERVAIYQMYENHSSCGMASFLYGIYEKHAGNRENMKSGFKLAIEWGIKRQVMEPYR
ncbi:hypothetical protein K0U07_04450, partial [bacterium]|nr:hypothetical protein [bacterium]